MFIFGTLTPQDQDILPNGLSNVVSIDIDMPGVAIFSS